MMRTHCINNASVHSYVKLSPPFIYKKLSCRWGTARRSSHLTRNTLDCDQLGYSSRSFYYVPIEFGPTENIAPFDPPTPKTLA